MAPIVRFRPLSLDSRELDLRPLDASAQPMGCYRRFDDLESRIVWFEIEK